METAVIHYDMTWEQEEKDGDQLHICGYNHKFPIVSVLLSIERIYIWGCWLPLIFELSDGMIEQLSIYLYVLVFYKL